MKVRGQEAVETRLATLTGYDFVRVVALTSGMKCKNGKLDKGRFEMMKRLLSVAAVLALFSAVALAQDPPAGGPQNGPDPAAVQQGPEGLMRGRTYQMRVRRTMRPGPRMGFHRRGMGQWWRNPALAEKIGLNDQQKQQLEKIGQSSRLKMIDLRADMEKQRVILGPMLQTYHPDEAQVLAQVEKVSQARAALEKARIQAMLASRNVLTEDQWNKLRESRMEFRRGFRHRGLQRHMGPRMPAPPPSK